MTDAPLRCTILLRALDDTIAGRVVDTEEGSVEFRGWLGLLSALQALAAGPGADHDRDLGGAQ